VVARIGVEKSTPIIVGVDNTQGSTGSPAKIATPGPGQNIGFGRVFCLKSDSILIKNHKKNRLRRAVSSTLKSKWLSPITLIALTC
jgi:hypothetical protein